MDIRKQMKLAHKKDNYFSELKHICKCGHTVVIPNFVEKVLCSWCGRYVYRDEQSEFKDKLKQKINNIK